MFTRGRRGPELRPFAASADVVCRGYSPALQRAMTDFGADEPFAAAAAKVREHYGIDVPVGAVRAITEQHGAAMLAGRPQGSPWPAPPGVPRLIAEMDGSMVPRVDTAPPGPGVDRRKTRQLSWTEARLCLVRAPGAVTPRFGATMGSVEAAGDQLWECAVTAGLGQQTRIHAVGDGASWIADQVERTLGAQATYLVDFYHVCDYLAAAAAIVAAPEPRAWLTEKQAWLKANRWSDVLDTLRPSVEPDDVADDAAPRPSAPVSAICRTAPAPWTTSGRWPRTSPSARARSRARIATSCKADSNAPAPGGRPIIWPTWWRFACCGPTVSGTPIGPASISRPRRLTRTFDCTRRPPRPKRSKPIPTLGVTAPSRSIVLTAAPLFGSRGGARDAAPGKRDEGGGCRSSGM